MRRKGFLMNSTVLLLLIPLMLLLATYENVAYQIVQAQSEKIQIERTSGVISYLETDFQQALEISSRRAIIAATEYVATRDFIPGRANDTIAHLIVWGESPEGIESDQSIKTWLGNVTRELERQGYEISPSPEEILSNMTITVAPLDSFRIAVIARLPEITIRSRSGGIVYEGAFPGNGNATAIVSIEGIEDTFISRETYDLYHRLIKACRYPYPELVEMPIRVLNGTGSSPQEVITGIYGDTIQFNETHIWTGDSYVTNINSNGVPVSPTDVLKDGDTGVIFFQATGTSSSWCSALPSRVNVTITSSQNLVGYQLKIDLNSVPELSSLSAPPQFEIYYPDCSGPIRYWVESWSTDSKVVWIRLNLTAGSNVVSIYFDPTTVGAYGSPDDVFDLYDDFNGNSLDFQKWTTDTGQYTVGNGYIKMWGDWNGKYLNTRTSFNFPVTVEGVWRLGQTGTGKNGDTDLAVSFLNSQTSTPYSSNSVDAVYDGTGKYCDGFEIFGICFGKWDYGGKRIVYKGNDGSGTRVTTTSWVRFQINYTSTELTFWDERLGAISYSGAMFMPFYIGISADTDDEGKYGYIDWIRVRKYANPEPTYSIGAPEERPTSPLKPAHIYDIQPFVSCLENGYYFGLYNAPSFFERLEGDFDPDRHREYVELSLKVQNLLGLSYNGRPYPIGLVSFIMPGLDGRIKLVLSTAGLDPENPNPEGQSCADYYFLKYYIGDDDEARLPGYLMYGVSTGDVVIDPQFYIDSQTALAIFGNNTVAVSDLLTG